jgi:signal transduction histidine kinase
VTEEKRREFYEVMLADSERLLHTVEQVLRAGQTGQRRRRLNPAMIDLGAMVRENLELARTRYHLPAGALEFDESLNGKGRALVLGDVEELSAAVSNLIDNAIKYSGEEVKIKVMVEGEDARHVSVRVRDSGVGIPKAHLKRIFNRFYRAPSLVMSRVKGTGLGLFIVRSVVRKHGGRVFAESAGPGQGSTFTIQLPRA